MAIKIYGAMASICTRRVLTTLTEKAVPYELIPVDLHLGEQKSQQHMAMQPFAKVPVFEEDGFMFYESRAICRYIAKKYAGQGTSLVPAEDDLKAFAEFEQACSVEAFDFEPHVAALSYEKVYKGWRGEGGPDEAVVAKHAAALDAALAIYEKTLSKTKYLAGDQLTLVDLFQIPYGKFVKDAGYTSLFEKYPHVTKWFDGLLARDSWVEVIN